MAFSFDYSDRFNEVAERLRKKDPQLAAALAAKIRQIVQSDEETVEHYKNMRAPLNEYKRVHVGNFVLIFKVFKKEKFILFEKFAHHDDAY